MRIGDLTVEITIESVDAAVRRQSARMLAGTAIRTSLDRREAMLRLAGLVLVADADTIADAQRVVEREGVWGWR